MIIIIFIIDLLNQTQEGWYGKKERENKEEKTRTKKGENKEKMLCKVQEKGKVLQQVPYISKNTRED
jgi:hypothetical protein